MLTESLSTGLLSAVVGSVPLLDLLVSFPTDTETVADVVPSGLAGLDWRLALIPPITGIIGYMTNWVAIRLMFYPVELPRGIRTRNETDFGLPPEEDTADTRRSGR